MAELSLQQLFEQLPPKPSTAIIEDQTQVQDQGKGPFFCWAKRSQPNKPVPTMIVEDATAASEWFIDNIHASTPWPQWVEKPDGTHGPESLASEIRVCIDYQGNEFLVGEVDWLDGDDMRHAELWDWFGPEDQVAFERLWASMKQGKNEGWF